MVQIALASIWSAAWHATFTQLTLSTELSEFDRSMLLQPHCELVVYTTKLIKMLENLV